MALNRLVDPELGGDQRVMEKVAPDLIGRIGEIVGGEQEAWRSDAVGGDDDNFRALELGAARVAVDEIDARGPPIMRSTNRACSQPSYLLSGEAPVYRVCP